MVSTQRRKDATAAQFLRLCAFALNKPSTYK